MVELLELDNLEKKLEGKNIPEIRKFLKQLVRKNKINLDTISLLVSSPVTNVRFLGALMCGEIDRPYLKELLPILRKFASDYHWVVREGAASALGRLGHRYYEDTILILSQWITDRDENIRRCAVLGTMQNSAKKLSTKKVQLLLTILEKALDDESNYVRKHLGPFALNYLFCACPTVVYPYLEKWSDSGKERILWNVTMTFSQAAGRKHSDKAMAILNKLAKDPRYLVQEAVTVIFLNLYKTKPAMIKKTLNNWLTDKNLERTAQFVLEKIKHLNGKALR